MKKKRIQTLIAFAIAFLLVGVSESAYAFTHEEWGDFYDSNSDFPATDTTCQELDEYTEEHDLDLDEAWEEMQEKDEDEGEEEGEDEGEEGEDEDEGEEGGEEEDYEEEPEEEEEPEITYKQGEKLTNPELIKKLEDLGKKLGADKTLVTDGDRTPKENEKLDDAAKDSQHMKNKAADVKFYKDGKQIPPEEVAKAAKEMGFGGIGSTYDTHTHVDTRDHKPDGSPTEF